MMNKLFFDDNGLPRVWWLILLPCAIYFGMLGIDAMLSSFNAISNNNVLLEKGGEKMSREDTIPEKESEGKSAEELAQELLESEERGDDD